MSTTTKTIKTNEFHCVFHEWGETVACRVLNFLPRERDLVILDERTWEVLKVSYTLDEDDSRGIPAYILVGRG